MRRIGDGSREMPDFEPTDKQRVERANQIFLRLKKKLHDRKDARIAERDVEEAAQGARWLREIVERNPRDWDRIYKASLSESDLTEEDKNHLRGAIESAEGFSKFVQRNLQRLEEPSADGRQNGDETSYQDLACGVATGLLAGGVMMQNLFYFGFAVGMSRKAECW